jgi:hypothetical protein
VTPIASAGRVGKIRKGSSVNSVVHIDSISEARVDRRVIAWEWCSQHTADNQPQRDIRDIVKDPTAIGETRGISSRQAQPARRCIRGWWHARVEP